MINKRQKKLWSTLLSAFVVSVMLFIAQPAQAYHFPWDQGHDTTDWNDPPDPGTCEGDNCDPCSGTGSPVYLITGHLIWSATDLNMGGIPSLSITRTYNSNDPREGVFGNGWTIGCEVGLFQVDKSGSNYFVLRLANGKRHNYRHVATNRYESDSGRFDYVEIQSDNSVRLVQLDSSYQAFNTSGLLIERVDRHGRSIHYNYLSGTSLPVSIFDDHGREINFTYNSAGRVVTVSDHTGRVWNYGYDSAGNLISVINPLGGERHYEYQTYTPTGDSFIYHQLTRVIDETGVVEISATYNADRVVSYTEGENRFTYSYDTNNRQVTKTDLQSSQWTYFYDTVGLITKETDPLGNSVQSEFNTDGLITKLTDQLGMEELSTYDTLGRLTSETDQLGNETHWEYEGDKPWPFRITSPTGRITEITYDSVGNPVTITNAAGFKGSREYNASGDLLSSTDASGNSTVFSYNSIGLLTSVTDALGQTNSFDYDTLGNLISTTNPEGEVSTFSYDVLNRLIGFTDPSGITIKSVYDGASRLSGKIDAKENGWAFEYDSFGRLSKSTAPDGRFTSYQYRNDNLLLLERFPDGKVCSYQYDETGQVSQKSCGGQVESYSYDARGDMLSVSSDGLNYLKKYDGAGHLVQEQLGINNTIVDYSYNGENELERYQIPALGISAAYSHDTRGLLTKLAWNGGTINYQYDEVGKLIRELLPSNTEIVNVFDAIGQIKQITHGLSSSIQYEYSHDGAGRILTRTGGGLNWQYFYDKSGRLVSANNGTNGFTYQYDALGNRLNGGSTYDAFNKLISDDNHEYTYDSRGNLLEKKNKTSGERSVYGWSNYNRLIRFEHFANTNTVPDRIAKYKYNPFGERIQKEVDGVITNYLWVDGRLTAELDDNNQLMVSYIYSDEYDFPVSITTGNNTYYIHSDHLDTPLFLTDSSGTTVWTGTAEPYGKTIVDEDPDGDGVSITFNFRFPGQYYDHESELHYNYARYYDPATGKYISADPIGLISDDINLYRYARNNPVGISDIFGLGKGGKGNQIDEGLRHLTDQEVSDRARDRNLSGEERRRYQKEEKARGKRNKNKRRNNKGKGKGGNSNKFCPLPEPRFQPSPSFDPTPYVIGGVIIILVIGAIVITGGGAAAGVPALASDRHRKRNVEDIDNAKVLNNLASLNISSWTYDWEDDGIRHIGPMAQDFYNMFQLGDDDKKIEVVDSSGVLYAAVQELYTKLKERDKKISELESRLDDLESGK
jgi:RHS repeat-associated protein